jgi:amidophosphoribosyltransferase
MPTRMELMAANLNQEQIRQKLGVDKLLYLSIDSLVEAVNRGHPEIKSPCMACMNGHYISGDITEAKIEALQNLRLKDKIPA